MTNELRAPLLSLQPRFNCAIIAHRHPLADVARMSENAVL